MNRFYLFSIGVLLTLFLSWLVFIVGARQQFGSLEPTVRTIKGGGPEPFRHPDGVGDLRRWFVRLTRKSLFNPELTSPMPENTVLFPQDFPGIAKQGAEEYVALGCISCHTQQVRLVEASTDVERDWGKRPSVPRDYVLQDKVLLGNSRIGPDLANIALRDHSEELLHRHLFDPQATVPGSICPPNPFLYNETEEAGPGTITVLANRDGKADQEVEEETLHIVPTHRANKIVAYLQALGQDYELPEMAFVKIKQDDRREVLSLGTKGNATLEDPDSPTRSDADRIAAGKKIYMSAIPGKGGFCFTCHQPDGTGKAEGFIPPLAGSDWVTGEKEILIKILSYGLKGPIKVSGKDFGQAPMLAPGIPPGSLTNQQIADVLTYIRNSWDNSASVVLVADVASVRAAITGRGAFQQWTAAELKVGSE